jgi:hypothetical protein
MFFQSPARAASEHASVNSPAHYVVQSPRRSPLTVTHDVLHSPESAFYESARVPRPATKVCTGTLCGPPAAPIRILPGSSHTGTLSLLEPRPRVLRIRLAGGKLRTSRVY